MTRATLAHAWEDLHMRFARRGNTTALVDIAPLDSTIVVANTRERERLQAQAKGNSRYDLRFVVLDAGSGRRDRPVGSGVLLADLHFVDALARENQWLEETAAEAMRERGKVVRDNDRLREEIKRLKSGGRAKFRFEAYEVPSDNDEVHVLLGLIDAEFRTDPMSVQCFDLGIVERVRKCVEAYEEKRGSES